MEETLLQLALRNLLLDVLTKQNGKWSARVSKASHFNSKDSCNLPE